MTSLLGQMSLESALDGVPRKWTAAEMIADPRFPRHLLD